MSTTTAPRYGYAPGTAFAATRACAAQRRTRLEAAAAAERRQSRRGNRVLGRIAALLGVTAS